MPVIPHHSNRIQNQPDLYQLLLPIQQRCADPSSPHLVSISLQTDTLDPLAILQAIASEQQPHFYFEKQSDGEAIAAIGSTLELQTEGSQRFSESQQFVDFWHKRCTVIAPVNAAITLPRFFCSYTFFDDCADPHSPFAAGLVCLPQWQITRQQTQCFVTANIAIHAHSNLEELTANIWRQYEAICQTRYGMFPVPHNAANGLHLWTTQDVNPFSSAVQSALEVIQSGQVKKVVLAHAVDVVSCLPFQWAQSLHNLRRLHPDCRVFSMSNGRGQTFLGASPERLIAMRDRHLITDALAGSAPRGTSPQADQDLAQQLLNNAKERREHQLVVDFMGDRLRALGLNPAIPTRPTLLPLANIQHLHTPIQATVPASLPPLTILANLHPTPAVAGMPGAIALECIQQYETFERCLYAAPLGWVDGQGNAEFIVGIRSALLNGCRARLYAGAGIVAGSDPTRELAEVKLKLQALLRALV